MKFLDHAKVYVRAGDGGRGSMSFRRERNLEFGGPNGGNGGRGGSVIAIAVDNLNTLIDFRNQQHFRAKNGRPGEGQLRSGADGEDIVLRVPPGTEFLEAETEVPIAELTAVGQTLVLAHGGDGGMGNNHYKTSTNRAPRKTTPGFPGEERVIEIKLRLIADAGLVGLPNAGKSTFLAAVSAARPKIADYPFTTLIPQLGVVAAGEQEFVLADLPGLIEGAHEGIGLGDQFLAHVERCRVLLHLVDVTQDDPVKAWRTIRKELKAYGHGLGEKHEIVGLSKCDAMTKDEYTAIAKKLAKATKGEVFVLSSQSGLGIQEVTFRLVREVTGVPASGESEQDGAPAKTTEGWQP